MILSDIFKIGVALACVLATNSASAADLAGGGQTYAAICASCHGADGNAVLTYAPSFARGDALDRDDAALLVSVRDGVFRMPPWGGVLSEREIGNAIAYARTLHTRSPRQSEAIRTAK